MDLGLKDKVALITGGSSGLGLAVARTLAEEGARTAIASRSAEKLEQAAASMGPRASTFVCDMGDADAREELVGRVEKTLGPIDILVVNGGGPPPGGFDDVTPQQFDQAINEHLGAAVSLFHGVVPGMRRRGWGRILTITSLFVKAPGPNMILSNTARAAVCALTKSCANEFARDGITVNSLLPGYTATDRLTSLTETMAERAGKSRDDVVDKLTAGILARRLGDPKEFAAVAAFLCAEQAGYVNGVALSVDGGSTPNLF
ncbi:SDR family oxidoreductase [Pacificimonas sp. ICDLI1SI03]